MNLTEALDAALPEMPQTQLSRSRPPRLDPNLVVHEYVLDGEPTVGILQRGKSSYFRFLPVQWDLARLFDGERTYQEIADAFREQTGTPMSVEEVRTFAQQLDDCNFWHKTYQEKNLAMREKLLAQRGRRTKSKFNPSHISFSAWDPDRYLGWLDRMAGWFIYGRWCLLSTLFLFVFEAVVVIENWHFIGPDTAQFFNFAAKGPADYAQFWILMLMIGFFHESAHGLTCKHFGGQVHSMGLLFLYLVPCFFVDVTESWVSATKIQRLATIMAGIWIELVMCGVAMIFWVNTPVGSSLHNLLYAIILLTGIAAVVVNLNPLIKLDGYYLLTEIIEQPELKERSTAFLSAWFQAKVLRLPVDVPIVPRRRVALFAVYAILSGAYSYLLLFFVIRLSYRIGSKWFAELALIPSLALAFVLFRSRLLSLRRMIARLRERTMKNDFKWSPVHALAGAGLIAVLFVPLWRDRLDGYFVIEPAETHTICAAVPGRVEAVLVQEGQQVRSGQQLLEMTSYRAASMRSSALAQTRSARFRSVDAQMQGRSVGTAIAEQAEAQHMTRLANEAQTSLDVAAPADGTVLTNNPALLLDQDVGYGQPLLRLAEGARMVRIFIPSSALDRISPGSEVTLEIPGQFSVLRLKLAAPDGDSVSLPPGLVASEKYQGIKMPVFYTSRVLLPPVTGNPMYGLSGQAKIFGKRRSIAGRVALVISDVARAHVWW